MSPMDTIAIIGAGLAGTECTRSYRDSGGTADLILIDPRPERCELPPLSKTLFARELSHTPLPTPEATLMSTGATHIAPGHITLAGGSEQQHRRIDASRIVIATGLRARRPQTPLPGGPVHTIRTAADAAAIRQAAKTNTDIGILGSGYLALEAARSAADAGHQVTVYLRGDQPLAAAHHPAISRALMDRHAAAGVRFVLDADPSDYAAHALWIAAIGAAPVLPELPADWDRDGAGRLRVDAGLHVCAGGTTVPNVWAIGDLAHPATGPMAAWGAQESEAAAASQGAWLGAQLASAETAADRAADRATDAAWTDVPWHWSFQGPERVFAAGRVTGTHAAIVSGDEQSGRFQVLHFIDGVLCGAETLNQPPAHNAARKILALPPASRPTASDAAGGALDLRAWVRRLRS